MFQEETRHISNINTNCYTPLRNEFGKALMRINLLIFIKAHFLAQKLNCYARIKETVKFYYMKKILISALAMAISLSAFSETAHNRKKRMKEDINSEIENTRNLVFTLDIISPSIGFETKLGSSSSLLMAYSSGDLSTHEGLMTKEMMVPSIKTELRSYYNFKKRAKQGKRINKFSGNFVSLYTDFRPEYLNAEREFIIGPTWGIQRAYLGFIHLNLNLGYGYVFDKVSETDQSTPIMNFKLGFIF